MASRLVSGWLLDAPLPMDRVNEIVDLAFSSFGQHLITFLQELLLEWEEEHPVQVVFFHQWIVRFCAGHHPIVLPFRPGRFLCLTQLLGRDVCGLDRLRNVVHREIRANDRGLVRRQGAADPDLTSVRGHRDPGHAELLGSADPAFVGLVARGSFPSPDYRVGGRIPADFLDGTASPPTVPIDVVLRMPAGSPPPTGHPVVILAHGFCGSNDFVVDGGNAMLEAGLAVVGISAPEHRLGEECLDFFDFDDVDAI